MPWTVEFFNSDVIEALTALPPDIRSSFERLVHMIEAHGLELMREPYVKHLEGPVWEMRMKGKDESPVLPTSPRLAVGSWWCTSFRKRRRRHRGVRLSWP
jgi:hypothetical protein